MDKRIVWLLASIVLLYSIASHRDFARSGDEKMEIGDLFKKIEAAYMDINDYKCRLLSNKGDGEEESMEYYFKKPKKIRMELINPHKGAIITYRSEDTLVYVSPFSWFRRIVFSFRLDNPMVMSSNGHRVDESGMGSFIDTILKPAIQRHEASLSDTNPEISDAYLIKVELTDEVKGRPNNFKVWIDKRLFLPVRIDSYYPDWRLLESVTFKGLIINSGLSNDLFRLKR